jgi:FMN phosphatase YigB (HAD superfamily)
MNEIKGVIFDLWNTLIQPIHHDHGLKLLKNIYGVRGTTRKQISKELMINPTNNLEEMTELIKDKFGLERPSNKDFERMDYRFKQDNIEVGLFLEVIPTLQYLKENNIKIALISNAATIHKEPFYNFGLDQYFDYTCFSCDVGLWKPDKEIYQLTLDKIGLKPEEVIMTGDHFYKDGEAPRTLGIQGLHLDRFEERPRTPHRIESLYELTEIINYQSNR